MFKQIVIVGMFLAVLNAQCGSGCLHCHKSTNQCLYCDVNSGYMLSYGRCETKVEDDCLQLTSEGDCLLCNTGFYLDNNTSSCVEIPKEVTAQNCSVYSDQYNCQVCNSGYYLNNGGCIAVTTKIANCDLYESESFCSSCSSGYVPSLDHTTCVATSSDNCLSYSFLECRSCVSGYMMNDNNFIYNILGFENALQTELLTEHMALENIKKKDLRSYGVCQPYVINNCAIYSTFNKCQICNSGYLLQSDGTCKAYPKERIDYCEKYSSLSICISCIQGKYLKASNNCVDIVPIDNCKTYSQSSSTTVCTQCESNYYLLQNKCVTRTSESNITNCVELQIDSETCKTCDTGYKLTDDKKKCLATIAQCEVYRPTTVTSTTNECISCIAGFYYDSDEKICVQGGLEHCKIYQTNDNICAECQSRYYLISGACYAHDVLDYCVSYSQSILNTCVSCDDNSYLFSVQNTCTPVIPIDHCETYSSIDECSECIYGYYLSDAQTCSKIPVQEHCLRKSGDDCIICDDNYVLDDAACYLPLDYKIRNCESHNVDGLTSHNDIVCNYCQEFSIPIEYEDNYLCYENDYLEDKLGVTLDSNCYQYKLVDGDYECRRCVQGMYLQSGVCVSSCSGLTSTIYSHRLNHIDSDGDGSNDSFSVESVNTCFDTLANCKVATPDLYQPDPTNLNYSCVICNDGAVPIVTLSNEKILLRPPRFENDDLRLSPVSFINPITCSSSAADALVIGDLNNDGLVDNCESYYNVNVGSGCLSCKHGYTGIVVDTIFNCKIYTEVNRCSECNQGYYLETQEVCKPITPIDNCKLYSPTASSSECIECNPLYYLDNATTCTQRSPEIEHCATYTIDADTCSTCESNFWLDSNICQPKIPYCSTHTLNGGNVECTSCQDGYFVFETQCSEGTVTNCKTYSQADFNVCNACDNNFYLSNNTCNAQSVVSQCKTFGQTKGKCEECNAGYLLVSANNKCDTVTTIANCSVYSSLTTCQRCAVGFYVSNDAQRCLAIPADWHCDEYGDFTHDATNGCIKCDDDYLLKDGYCKNWYNIIKTNVDTTRSYLNDGLISARYCTYCANGYEVVSFDDDYICLEQDLIDTWSADSGTTKVMENCVRYNYVAGSNSMECIECASGYVINATNNTCILEADCPNNSEIFTIGITVSASGSQNNQFITSKGAFCQNNDTLAYNQNEKCYYSPETKTTVNNNVTYYCSKCFNGYLSFVDLTVTTMTITQGIAEMTSPVQSFITIDECVDPLNTAYTILGTQNLKKLIKNCDYYYQINGTNYGCLTCKKGYTGVVKGYDNSGTRDIGYIDTCDTEITGCDTSIEYTGLIPRSTLLTNTVFPYSVFFNSCHKCTNASEIPVAFVSGNATDGYANINGLWEYSTTTFPVVPTNTGDGDGLALRCLDPTVDVVDMTQSGIPTNCALAFVNAQSTDAASATTSNTTPDSVADNSFSIFCAACKSGYKALRRTATPEVITNCQVIPNCTVQASWTWLNTCQQCNTNYSYLWDGTKIQFDACTLNNSDNNCLAASSSKECIFCKKGYYLNASKVCEILTPPKCTTYYNNSAINYQYEQLGYYLAPKPNGCSACDSGYVLAKNFQDNSNIDLDDNVPTSLKYCAARSPSSTVVEPTIANCTATSAGPTYYWRFNLRENTNYCIDCAVGYIETKNGQCAASANYPNCLIATDTTSNKCETCNTNYASVAGVCKSVVVGGGVISNCQTYADSTFKTGAICTLCDDNYYIKNETIAGEVVSSCVLYTGDITNCAQFNSDDLEHIYCTKCDDTYALLILKDDVVNGVDGYARMCISISGKSDANCDAWDVTKQVIGQLECSTCNANTLLPMAASNDDDIKNYCVAIPTTTNCDEYDLVTTLFNNKSYNPALSSLNCKKCIATHYLDEETYQCVVRTNDSIDNCAEYEIAEDNCKRCDVNYILTLDKLTCDPSPAINSSPSIVMGNILSCREMKECTLTYYEGLHPHLNAMTSCHKCINSSQIPFIAVRGGRPYDTISGLNEYSLNVANNLTDGYDLTSDGSAAFCIEPTATNLAIPNGKFAFPTNCGLGILNTNAIPDSTDATKTSAVNRSKISTFCGACAPGYKATYAKDNTIGTVDVKFMIGTCTKINNCESSVWFNYCSQCSPEYTYSYTAATGVQYDVCVKYTANEDCHAVDITDSSNYKCKYCNKGSYLNADGYCERIKPPRCHFADFNFKLVYNLTDLPIGLYLDKHGTGCQQCQPGFSALYQESSNFVCTESEYHAAKKLTNGTQYLLNCKKYYVSNGLLKCQECYENYIPIDQTRICTIATSLSNCAIAANSSYCKECQPGYVLVNRKCEKANISNCIAYNNDESSIIQNCSKCAENYYLLANICQPGNVANCLVYETTQVCETCQPGYTLSKKKDGISYCYPINPSTNCGQFDEIEIQSGILKCSTCVSNQFVISSDASLFNPTLCMRFNEIPNCLKYDIQNQIGNSTFDCIQCTDNFYVNNGVCVYRTVFPDNCITYNLNNDTCETCKANYFVAADGKSCVEYPLGVRGCREYSDANTCVACNADKYLYDNACIDIQEADKVGNCLYYLNATVCQQCKAGFLLVDGVCTAVAAQNCATYTNINSCATCLSGYGFKTIDGVKECVAKDIQFCIVSEDEYPFKCTTCDKDYYPLDGVCTQVSTLITYCLEYTTIDKCNRCERGMSLSVDQKSCLSTEYVFDLIDYQCYDSITLEEPYCTSCQIGYYFDAGKCVACPEINGCRSCDPQDTQTCIICQTGYYQDETGKCQLNAIEQDDDDDTPDSSALRLTGLISLMFVLFTLIA